MLRKYWYNANHVCKNEDDRWRRLLQWQARVLSLFNLYTTPLAVPQGTSRVSSHTGIFLATSDPSGVCFRSLERRGRCGVEYQTVLSELCTAEAVDARTRQHRERYIWSRRQWFSGRVRVEAVLRCPHIPAPHCPPPSELRILRFRGRLITQDHRTAWVQAKGIYIGNVW